ncbi:hypothetical protein EON63_00330 [archaeon]|nr:MAG: hypothetical protein EON63_00330 [archaeon]
MYGYEYEYECVCLCIIHHTRVNLCICMNIVKGLYSDGDVKVEIESLSICWNPALLTKVTK